MANTHQRDVAASHGSWAIIGGLTIRFPIAIEIGSETLFYGIVVPDMPGCLSAGETLDEAVFNAEEPPEAQIDVALDAGESVPSSFELSVLRSELRFGGWSFGAINVAEDKFQNDPAGVNVLLPRRVFARLDAQAKAAGKIRSGYIAEMTLRARP